VDLAGGGAAGFAVCSTGLAGSAGPGLAVDIEGDELSSGFAGAAAGTERSSGFSGTAFSGTGCSITGIRAVPPDAVRFMVEWTTITAVEIKPAAAIKTAASIAALKASETPGFFRLLARGLFALVLEGFFDNSGFPEDFPVFFMQIRLCLSGFRNLLYLSADCGP
jgi:hypothetical protein